MKNLIKILVASIIILSLFSACDKYHRDRYVGDWEFVTIIHSAKFNNIGEIIWEKWDTIYYSGQISAGNKENDIMIKYTENDLLSSFIDTEGEIYLYDYPCAGGYCARGRFEENNKVNLEFGWVNSIEAHKIHGIKREGGKNE
jgi:hypothetical protein